MSSRDLSTVVKTQKAFIKELLDRLAQREEDRCLNLISENFFMNINGSAYPLEQIKNLLNDPYFNGLTLEQILDLAKKSIRLTDDNCKMRHNLEDIEEIINAIFDFQVECKDKTNREFLDKQLQKIFDILLDK